MRQKVFLVPWMLLSCLFCVSLTSLKGISCSQQFECRVDLDLLEHVKFGSIHLKVGHSSEHEEITVKNKEDKIS